MEPLSTAVVGALPKETTATLKKESDTFLKAVYAEAAKALGSLLAVNVSKRLRSHLIKITVEVKRKLAVAEVSPREVPL